jgi:hypothetical protein
MNPSAAHEPSRPRTKYYFNGLILIAAPPAQLPFIAHSREIFTNTSAD